MAIFLFLKQIIDIFYTCKVLDYIMAALAVVIVCYQLWMLRRDTDTDGSKGLIRITLPDLCVASLLIIFVVHIIIDQSTDVFSCGKILTAFLLYLIGRLCRERIEECTWALVISSYIVVYANLIARIVILGVDGFFQNGDSDGLLYYFDTDLAYAMLLALVFIAMYARNHIIKFITIFVVCPFLIIHSDADIQKILMLVVYVVLLIFMAERAVKKRRFTDFILPIALICLLATIALLIMPLFIDVDNSQLLSTFGGIINTENFAGRYSAWSEMLRSMQDATLWQQLFGIGINAGSGMGNEYLAILCSMGIIGLILSLVFVLSIAGAAVHIEDRKTYYVTVMLAIIFLGTCIVVNGVEFTQMSWLPMMYAGMAVHSNKVGTNE